MDLGGGKRSRMANSEDYEKQDYILRLEQGLEDLKLLVSQQNKTISELHKESSLKSQKILKLEKQSGHAAVSTETEKIFQPKMHLSSVLSSSQKRTVRQPDNASTKQSFSIDAAKMAEKKIQQLQEEKEFWRRHFESANLELKDLRTRSEKQPLKEIHLNLTENVLEVEKEDEVDGGMGGTYVKKLLQENLELKERLERISVRKITSNNKENAENQHTTTIVSGSAKSDKKVSFGDQPNAASAASATAGASCPTSASRPAPSTLPSNQLAVGKSSGQTVRERMQAYRPPPPNVRQGSSVRQSGGPRCVRPLAPGGRPFAASVRPPVQGVRPLHHPPFKPPRFQMQNQGIRLACASSDQCPYDQSSQCQQTRHGEREQMQRLSEHNKCLMNQVYSLKEELERRAAEISCCCENRPPGGQPKTATCDRCPRITCRNEKGVRFEDDIDPSMVHLCEHIKCLQRQVCHLQYHATRLEPSFRELNAVQQKLETANSEVEHLTNKCDRLLEDKKVNLEIIANLNRKLDSLLAAATEGQGGLGTSRVRQLIGDIEVQRDRYKHSVETLIGQLRNNRIQPRVSIEELEPSRLPPERDSDHRCREATEGAANNAATSAAQAQAKPRRVSFRDEDRTVNGSLCSSNNSSGHSADSVEEKLRNTALTLHEAKMENLSLRRELMDCLSQLQQLQNKPGDKGTQTSPRSSPPEEPPTATAAALKTERKELAEVRDKLLKDQEALKLEKLKLEAERHVFENRLNSASTAQKSSNASASMERQPIAAASGEEVKKLVAKIALLEKQLENTENALRTNQNLIAENSGRTYELNSKVLELRQSLSQANRTSDELRVRLDKKDDFVRKVLDDKNELYNKMSAMKDRVAELEIELADTRDSLSAAREDKANLEKKQRLDKADLERREAAVRAKEREGDRLRDDLVRSESSSVSLQSENDALRKKSEALKVDLEAERSSLQEAKIEVDQLNAQLQIYISEVRRVEEALAEKEAERRRLLDQYEEVAREAHRNETVNRSLEMQTANLEIEVKGKQADLEAAKSRCASLEEYVEDVLRQNETFRTQIIALNAKVDMLTSDLQDNRIARDSVMTDLDGVNSLAVKLNTDKVDLMHRIGEQNNEVENLQAELASLREELLKAMSSLEDERHRARTLQNLITTTNTMETRETVIRERGTEKLVEKQTETQL